jgi:hypothetical protein
MKQSRFSEQQIAFILHQAEEGMAACSRLVPAVQVRVGAPTRKPAYVFVVRRSRRWVALRPLLLVVANKCRLCTTRATIQAMLLSFGKNPVVIGDCLSSRDHIRHTDRRAKGVSSSSFSS